MIAILRFGFELYPISMGQKSYVRRWQERLMAVNFSQPHVQSRVTTLNPLDGVEEKVVKC